MSTLAIAHVKNFANTPAFLEYLQRIDATLAPHQGQFLVHGGPMEQLEGDWSGELVVLQFPDRSRAQDWYHSDAYRAIIQLRKDSASADVFFVDTVPPGYRATDILG